MFATKNRTNFFKTSLKRQFLLLFQDYKKRIRKFNWTLFHYSAYLTYQLKLCFLTTIPIKTYLFYSPFSTNIPIIKNQKVGIYLQNVQKKITAKD